MSILDDMAIYFGVGPNDLAKIISTAPLRYKVYQIGKRNGGTRTIAQPSRELKALQRYLLDKQLVKFPVHNAAKGYVRGGNILANAREHLGHKVILKLDFKEFFPSILVADWERIARSTKSANFDRFDTNVCSRVMFWGVGTRMPICLSIGAPTSPMISNIVLFNLDTELTRQAKKVGAAYTRYADDITVSADTPLVLRDFEETARRVVSALKSPKLTFNEEKRGMYSKGGRRMVTGLILTPTNQISIGRERKRLISAMLHKVSTGDTDSKKMSRLKGLLGFCIGNEPSFIERMRRKYGDSIVDAVLRYEVAPRAGGPTS